MKKFLWLSLIFSISFILFYPLLFLYFVQDDFFLLTISKAYNLTDFLRFFVPATGVVWYRPLSSQIFFFICQSLFGLNPLPYHLLMMLTHLLNIYLVFLFAREISKKENFALISSFIYGVSSVHFITLAWLSTYSFILGPTFVLLTILCYLRKKYYKSLLFFVLGLLTSEVVIWTVIPLFIIELIYHKSRLSTAAFSRLPPFLLTLVVLFFVRNVLFPVEYVNAYSLVINPLVSFSLLKFYFYRTVGIPMLIKNMPNNSFKIIILSLSTAVILIQLFNAFFKRHSLKLLLLSLIIYISFLSIFLVLPNHYSPHYLSFALIGAALFSGLTILTSNKLIQSIFIIFYFSLQVITIKLTYDTHWIISRAFMAKQLVSENSLIHPVSSEEYISLGAGKAFELFSKK